MGKNNNGFTNGVRVTPAGSHGEGTQWAPARGEGLVPRGKDGKMIPESTARENYELHQSSLKKQQERKRAEGKVKVIKIK